MKRLFVDLVNRRRDERGATAVLVALLSVVLLSISALGVDLGNAWQEKRQVQVGSDLATEAGAGIAGANLPKTGSVNNCSYGAAGALATDQSVLDISDYLASQQYPLPRSGSAASAYATMKAALPAELTDCSMANGEVVYGTAEVQQGQQHLDRGFRQEPALAGRSVAPGGLRAGGDHGLPQGRT